MHHSQIPHREYAKLADEFAATHFDAEAWAQAASDAGMRYMVFTTRHHDGYCLYDSSFSEFTSVKQGPHRDFVAEYVDAFTEANITLGLIRTNGWPYPSWRIFKEFVGMVY